jgi:thiol:disulfide interchange protein
VRKILFLLIYFFITISLFSNPFELSDNSDIAEFNLSKSDIRVDGNNIIEFYVIGKIKSGWYIYANDKGPGTGKPFHINFETPNIKILKIEYPKGTRKDILELNEWVNVYKENFEVKIILQILQPINKIDLFIEALTCNKSCVPINKTLTINLVYENFENVLSSTSKDKINLISKNKSVFLSNNSSLKKLESFKIINKLDKKFNFYNLIFYSIIGLISGILLNFMPCVLPVLGIKVLSVINTVSERKNAVILGLFYSLGILSMFTVLAATLAFFNLQWGEHFSNPWFIISMIILVVFFSLGLFDLFFINVTLNL